MNEFSYIVRMIITLGKFRIKTLITYKKKLNIGMMIKYSST